MVKIFRTRSRISRKTRSDKGKKRKKYAGKLIKKKNIIKFEKRLGNKTHLKLWVWEKQRMSQNGRLRWRPKLRKKIKPFIYKFGPRIDVPVDDIASRELIERWSEDIIGIEGHFLIMGLSGSLRSKKGVKWVKMFEVVIKERSDGLRAKLWKNWRLYRYWFWLK